MHCSHWSTKHALFIFSQWKQKAGNVWKFVVWFGLRLDTETEREKIFVYVCVGSLVKLNWTSIICLFHVYSKLWTDKIIIFLQKPKWNSLNIAKNGKLT